MKYAYAVAPAINAPAVAPAIKYAVAPAMSEAPEWRLAVKNTFLDVVYENDRPTLTHVWSAPGKLVSGHSAPAETELQPSLVRSKTFGAVGSNCKETAQQGTHEFVCRSLELDEETNADADAMLLSKLVVEHEPHLVVEDEPDVSTSDASPKKLSKTASRNLRRRAQQQKNGVSPVRKSKHSPTSVKEAVADEPSGMDSTPTTFCNQHMEHSGIASEKDKNPAVKTSASQGAMAWSGLNPSTAERQQLMGHFMEIFRQEYKVVKPLSENSNTKVMTPEELSKHDCNSSRPLVSVRGNIYDVSSKKPERGLGGCHSFEAGRDITWAIVSGSRTKENCNCFYDIFKAKDDQVLTGRLMSLCRTLVMFQRDYGKAVGRLSTFRQEENLPPPPMADMEEICPVQ